MRQFFRWANACSQAARSAEINLLTCFFAVVRGLAGGLEAGDDHWVVEVVVQAGEAEVGDGTESDPVEVAEDGHHHSDHHSPRGCSTHGHVAEDQ
ncbi:hypothetical protein [Streptomyces sp. F001]|uniref:hypothetical protein n=1 Tax=Streptomyces sp. F001 TaxID=1510026 RepID=UPI001F0E8E41|nr:hypothetical protein [Streptomyces sp. F001]